MTRIFVFSLLASLALAAPAPAATFFVTNVDATGPGSLHQAVLDANENEGSDEIVFDIPEELCSAASVCAIATALPRRSLRGS